MPDLARRPRVAVAVVGRDQPGIVATVCATLLQEGCNVEDVCTSILSGHFAMILVADLAASSDLDRLRSALSSLEMHAIVVDNWDASLAPEAPPPTHALTVYGSDRPGIVHAVSRALAELDVNIGDMGCRLHLGSPPLYVLTAEIALPPGLSESAVEHAVTAQTLALDLTVVLRSVEQSEL